jgi:transcriptional regulator with XRE-family HTH domain
VTSVPALSTAIGVVVREQRNMLSRTGTSFAQIIGTHPETLSRLERGRATWRLVDLVRVAAALSMSVSSLIELAEKHLDQSGELALLEERDARAREQAWAPYFAEDGVVLPR